MTNTGDFRRYSYSADASYAIRAFDVQRSSAAPAYAPTTAPSRRKPLRVRENNKASKKSIAQLRKEQRLAFSKIVKISTVAGLCLVMLFGVLFMNAQKNELTYEISSLKSDIAVAESENTRLSSELDSLVSMDVIDKYAVEQLGMTKMKSNQIIYIDVSQYKEKRAAAAQKVLKSKEVKSKAAK